MSGPIHLSIIIPAFNQWPLTRACLESLRACTPGDYFEVLVADNASSDQTPQECEPLGRSLFGERFRYMRMAENINFGPACNAAANASRGALLFFLNNDTLLTPSWSTPLLTAFRDDPGLGAAGPLLTYPASTTFSSGRVQHAGICFDLGLKPTHLYEYFPADHPAVLRRRFPQAITAAALAVPAPLFRSVGGFWPGYANGYEDMDLCARLRKAGKRLAVIPASRVTHLAGQSPGRFEREETNSRLFRERCAESFAPDLHRLAARDGFRLRFTPWLASSLALPTEKSQSLNQRLAGLDDPRALSKALLSEPLWIEGYERLCALHVAAGRMAEAADALFLRCFFEPDLSAIQRLENLSLAAGRPAMAQECRNRSLAIQELLADQDRLHQRARTILAWAENTRDTLAAEACREYLAHAHGS